MKREMIVAYGKYDRAIGRRGDMPWGMSLPADLAHFRQQTMGASMIVGRETYESMPTLDLGDRELIVVSRNPLDVDEPISRVATIEQAYARARLRPMIIGGQTMYSLALASGLVDVIHATEVDARFPDADRWFPALDNKWREASRVSRPADARNRYPLDFVTYIRR